MSVFSMAGGNPALPTYPLQRSVRLRSSNSAYFNRTFTTPTNNIIWTWSAWVKRGTLGVAQQLMGTGTLGTGADQAGISLQADNSFLFYQTQTGTGTFEIQLATTQVLRDPSSWYHIVVAYDSAQGTSANRVKIYINGVQVTAFTTATYPTSSLASRINAARSHDIGRYGSGVNYFDGYLEEINFIDGQALTPSSFGTFNSYGVWSPAKYTGSYGTNGFYLSFQDNSSVTTTANVGIGADSSGNGNYWTSNGINVTAYSGTPPNNVSYDSMTDVPTNTSPTNANFAVMSPIDTGGGTIANGNLTVTTAGGNAATRATIAIPTTGKWYFEATDVVSGGNNLVGIANRTLAITANQLTSTGVIYTGMYRNSVFGFAFNFDALTYVIYENNVSIASGSITAGIEYAPFITTSSTAGSSTSFNFGQRPFSYTPPTGFKSLNTFNLPDSIVPVGAQYMAATTYTGNGTTQSLTNTVNGISFQPDFVWGKSRSAATANWLVNSVTGAGNGLVSNSTQAALNLGIVTSFNSNGFSVSTIGGTDSTLNGNASTYVGWQWRASNASAVTNTAGSITSQVSANQTAGFSVVTYTGTGANATVGHGLGVAPRMMIIKRRNSTSNWPVYHASISGAPDNFLYLNSTSAVINAGVVFNGVTPNSTVFGVGTDAIVNASGGTYVAYCFAAVPGYSAFGSYTGNGSADGPFVYTGFRPRWILLKLTSSAGGGWYIYDTSRNTYNVMDLYLRPDATDAETTFTTLDALSNGFKIRTTSTQFNGSGSTYIYAAFAENPFKNALAR